MWAAVQTVQVAVEPYLTEHLLLSADYSEDIARTSGPVGNNSLESHRLGICQIIPSV